MHVIRDAAARSGAMAPGRAATRSECLGARTGRRAAERPAPSGGPRPPDDPTLQIRRLVGALERAPDEKARAHLQYLIGLKAERLAAAASQSAPPAWPGDRLDGGPDGQPEAEPAGPAGPAEPGRDLPDGQVGDRAADAEWRLSELVRRGRPISRRRGPRRWRMAGILAAAGALTVTLGVLAGSRPGPSWPAGVGQVQREAAIACRNPNVAAEPSQVNFACAPATRKILWIFALMTSRNNPHFRDAATGRQGLEPIAPVQGGELAWSLNLHHPYDPTDPVDSIAVAARAINTIIGGATLTAASGRPVIRPGLEAVPANCLRYTGSAALTTRAGYPSLCARPVRSASGQAALVADVFARWVVGAPARAARSAAVLFRDATDPGAPQVQAVLRWLARSEPLG
jgi:hypothetical protein